MRTNALQNVQPGKHNAKIVEASEKGFEFELSEGYDRGRRIRYEPDQVISPNSKFGKAVSLLRGYAIMPGEEKVDFSEIIGKECSIYVEFDREIGAPKVIKVDNLMAARK